MRNRLLVVFASLFLARAAFAAPPPKGVHFPGSAGEASGYLALPEGGGRHPAILLVHEWWGLNDWVKEKARRFASQGYVALAVDLYRGRATDSPEVAHQLARGLPEDRALADLEAGFHWLAARPDVDPARIGVVGWCMGGGQALALAIHEPHLAAAAIYYGRLVTDPAAIAKIRAPLLGSFGAEDQGIPPESVRAFADAARRAGVQVDLKIYPGAGHAFASSKNPAVYKPAAARDADARTDAFFRRRLGASLYVSRAPIEGLRHKLAASGGDLSHVIHPRTRADLDKLESGHRYKFVLLEGGKLAIAPLPADAPHNEYVHPILADGAPVETAGGVRIDRARGAISGVVIDQNSASYCPSFESLAAAARAFERLGVPAAEVRLENQPPRCLPPR